MPVSELRSVQADTPPVDLEGVEEFGFLGWPVVDPDDNYICPLPDSCGHTRAKMHRQKMIGKSKGGGFNRFRIRMERASKSHAQ